MHATIKCKHCKLRTVQYTMGLNAEFGVGLDHLRLLFHSSVLHVVLGHAIHARHRCVSSGVNLRGRLFQNFSKLTFSIGTLYEW